MVGCYCIPHVANPTVKVTTVQTLTFRRNHPGGGPLGRCSYGVAGVPGIVVFDLGLFPGGIAPATITLDVPLATPVARKVAGVTSAVVAGANVAATLAASAPAIAGPAAVAAVAATVGAAVVSKARKGSKAHKAQVA